MGAKRKSIPVPVRDEVLREAGYKCGNPTCRHVLTLELHHIAWVKDGGGNEATNLLALCPNCHALHTKGNIPTSAIRHWKGILHALNHAFDREAMDLLLFLHKIVGTKVWHSGDGLLRFAGLIAANLVEIAQTEYAVGARFGHASPPTTPPASAHLLALTDRGSALVEAWLRGDEERYRAALGGS